MPSSHRILVVDDDANIRASLSEALAEYATLIVASGGCAEAPNRN